METTTTTVPVHNGDPHLNDIKQPLSEKIAIVEESKKTSFTLQPPNDVSPAPEYSENGILCTEHVTSPIGLDINPPSFHHAASFGSLTSRETSSSLRMTLSHTSQDSVHPLSNAPSHGSEALVRWDQTPRYSTESATAGRQTALPTGHDQLIDQDHLTRGSLAGSFAGSVADYPQGRLTSSTESSSKASSLASQRSQARETGNLDGKPIETGAEETMTENDQEMQQTNQISEKDLETLTHEEILKKRKTLPLAKRCVIGGSIVVGVVSVIATIILLSLSKNKTMARTSFMTGTLLVEFALGAGMWAGEMTTVEVLIGMNIVFVCGIFLTSNIDALMADNLF